MTLSPERIEALEERYIGELKEEEFAREETLMDTLPGATSLTRVQIEQVIDWKMSRQGGRATQYKNDLDAIADATIDQVTASALSADYLRTQLDVLRALPGIGVGVGTAILGFVFPSTHVVADYIVYNGVFETNKDSISPAQATDLIRRLRENYGDTPFTLRKVDRALFVKHGGLDN